MGRCLLPLKSPISMQPQGLAWPARLQQHCGVRVFVEGDAILVAPV